MNRLVLGLDTKPRIAVAIARSLHPHAIPVDGGVMYADEPALSSRAVRQFLRFPHTTTVVRCISDSILLVDGRNRPMPRLGTMMPNKEREESIPSVPDIA